MSSYLNIYGILKDDKKKKPQIVLSFSRSDNLYQDFVENEKIAFVGNLNEAYSDLTNDMMKNIIREIKSDITSTEKRIVEYEKYASKNESYIHEILESKEYLEDLKRRYYYAELISIIVSDEYSSFEKFVCNID